LAHGGVRVSLGFVKIQQVVFLGCVCVSWCVYADDTHYQDYVLGGRSVGLGGAYTALSDDPSGVYFNPAGLADLQSNDLQLSTNLYGYEQGSIQSALSLPVLGKASFADVIVVPASAGFASLAGSSDSVLGKRHAYGLSVVVPSYRSFSVRSNDENKTYQRQVTDRELWSGIGYAYKINARLRLGISAYYVLRIGNDREDFSERGELQLRRTAFRVVNNHVSYVNGNVVFIVGGKYWFTPQWSVGLSVRMPSVQAHSQSELHFSRGFSDPNTGESVFERYETSDSRSQTHYSPVVRLGSSYQKYRRMLLSADLSYHAPVTYRLLDVPQPYLNRLPFSPRVQRRHVLNLNMGGEFYVVQDVSVSVGFFTNFSSAPQNSEKPLADELPHVNIFGASLAMNYSGDHTITRIGFVYSAGKGTDVVPQGSQGVSPVLDEDARFQKVDYVQSFLYLYVSGSFRY
jgi:hypothetical protein